MKQLNITIPLISYPLVFWTQKNIFEHDELPDDFHIEWIRLAQTVSMVLTLYLCHVSFYSSTNSCWDSCGFYVHFVVATIVFIVSPIAQIFLVLIDIGDSNDSAYGPPFIVILVTNACLIVTGLTVIRAGFMETRQWYKNRRSMGG